MVRWRGRLRVLAGMVLLAALPGAAGAVALGETPDECEIQAALLGTAGSGCPARSPRPAVQPPSTQDAVVPPATPVTPPLSAASVPPTPPAGTTPVPPAELQASFLINFDFASTRIRPESRLVLDRVAAVMARPEAAGLRFRIVGHTDSVGSDAANLALSQRRAAAVKAYLVGTRHIAAERLESEGRGEAEPADPAHPTAAANRRVVIVNLGPFIGPVAR